MKEKVFDSNFNSLYGSKAAYVDLYNVEGSPATQRMDTRLGEADDDEDEDEAPSTPQASPGSVKENFFSKEHMGFPNWLIGVFLLGFAYAYRRRKKAEIA